MNDLSNRWRGQRWRELVALQLQLAGVTTASARQLAAKPSESFEGDDLRPDIVGVPGWYLDAAADIQSRLSSRLDAAEQGAALTGSPHAAVALYRQGRASDEAYVVMTLATFARLASSPRGLPN